MQFGSACACLRAAKNLQQKQHCYIVDWVVFGTFLRCLRASKNPTDRQQNSESSGVGTVNLASEPVAEGSAPIVAPFGRDSRQGSMGTPPARERRERKRTPSHHGQSRPHTHTLAAGGQVQAGAGTHVAVCAHGRGDDDDEMYLPYGADDEDVPPPHGCFAARQKYSVAVRAERSRVPRRLGEGGVVSGVW